MTAKTFYWQNHMSCYNIWCTAIFTFTVSTLISNHTSLCLSTFSHTISIILCKYSKNDMTKGFAKEEDIYHATDTMASSFFSQASYNFWESLCGLTIYKFYIMQDLSYS